jgi:hypothetical protein
MPLYVDDLILVKSWFASAIQQGVVCLGRRHETSIVYKAEV